MDTEEVEATYVRTAARMSRMSLPILVSCLPVLSSTGILGRSWRPLWEPESPRMPLSALRAYQWGLPLCWMGGTNWHNRPDFRCPPTAKSPLFQLRNGVDVSPDVSGTKMGSCSKIKSHENCTYATP